MKGKKMSAEVYFPNMEIAERLAVSDAPITLYSALSLVLIRDVNHGSV